MIANITLPSLQQTVNTVENYVAEAWRSLSAAERRCRSAREELEKAKRDQAIVGLVSAGGWVAGSIMVTVSLTVLETNVQQCKSALSSCQDVLASHHNSLSSAKSQGERSHFVAS
jgi:hypothetical protein